MYKNDDYSDDYKYYKNDDYSDSSDDDDENDDGENDNQNNDIKGDDIKGDNSNINEFEGSNYHINEWKQCIYCQKYHPEKMYLNDINYCGHCWGWLNSNQIDLTSGKYLGDKTIEEIHNFLKLTYPLHSLKCVNEECIYNKINTLNKSNKLHNTLCVCLGFEKIEVKEEKKEYIYNIKKPHSNIYINYNLSNVKL